MIRNVNNINRQIQFTLWTKINITLYFLDLTVVNSKFQYSVYKKSTLLNDFSYYAKDQAKRPFNYDNYCVYKPKRNCNTFHIGYKISLKFAHNFHFVRYVVEINHTIDFDINNDLEIMISKDNDYINYISIELYIYKKVNENKCKNILNMRKM